MTFLDDGEGTSPFLIKSAIREPITLILDWWHLFASSRAEDCVEEIANKCVM